MTQAHDLDRMPGWAARTTLRDGRPMPLLGFGTQYGWSEDGHDRGRVERAHEYVALALGVGFRMVDTARCYGTEADVLRGIEASGIAREDVFVVSKAWPGIDHPPGAAASRRAIEESAARLGGYVDLFLVHHPVAGWRELYTALEDAQERGLVRSLGVSNFGPAELDELARFARRPPVANQIHLHPLLARARAATLARCAEDRIQVIGFPRSPWREARGSAVDTIAAALGCTRAQVMLRWALERGIATVPLSTRAEHLRENLAVGALRLDSAQMAALEAAHDAQRVQHAVDRITAEVVEGWAYAPGGLAAIRVLVDGAVVGDAIHGGARPDVRDALGEEGALASGFGFRFAPGTWTKPEADVAVRFEPKVGPAVLSRAETVRPAEPTPEVPPHARPGAPRLSDGALEGVLARFPRWRRDGTSIVRTAKLADFRAALDALVAIGALAEAEDHHPDLALTGYRNVTVRLSTHDAGSVTLNDFVLARGVDGVLGEA